jgi:hypothetical protein
MSYSSMVSSEHSSGVRVQRGGITKTGNAHLRRVIVAAAWAYQHKPWLGGWLAKRQQGLDEETKSHRLESAMATVYSLQKTARQRQKQAADRYRYRPRTAGLHLGNRSQGRTPGATPMRGMTTPSSGPAIPSHLFLTHRRRPLRLPFGALRSALTEPGVDAEHLP